MDSNKKATVLYYLTLISAIWFAISSMFWVYYLNLVFSFPVGIISFILWEKNNQTFKNTWKNKVVALFLALGVILAIVSFFVFTQ